jgi:L-rhamnose mutarotase
LLILTLRVVDFEAAWSQIDKHPVNLRWQKAKAPLFAPPEGLRAGEHFPKMEEVVYLP